jgi:gamma-glutamyltranspeptidase
LGGPGRLVGSYRNITIYNTPPPTQGFTVIEMFNLLEPHELHRKTFLGPDHIHLLVQAKQIAHNDRDNLLADPDHADVLVEPLISKTYAKRRAGLIDPAAALPWDKVPSYGSLSGDTVYVVAVNGDGNAASLIQSLYGAFGSCIVAGTTGLLLHNRGAYFSLDPQHPNRLESGKMPLHTLIAYRSIVFSNPRLHLSRRGTDSVIANVRMRTFAPISQGQW